MDSDIPMFFRGPHVVLNLNANVDSLEFGNTNAVLSQCWSSPEWVKLGQKECFSSHGWLKLRQTLFLREKVKAFGSLQVLRMKGEKLRVLLR
jgi:hypothetical protein